MKDNLYLVGFMGAGKSTVGAEAARLLGRRFIDLDRVIETRTDTKIAALEEIAYRNGWIDRETLIASAEKYGKSPYGAHLRAVADNKIRY